MRDLKLRREALDKFNLPVDVLEGKHAARRYERVDSDTIAGYLGELTLTIPWNNLRGKPVVIHVKDAYVLAVPRNESTVSDKTLHMKGHSQPPYIDPFTPPPLFFNMRR